MPQYVYKVATQSGRVMTQAAEATSETEMRERLLADGYYVYSSRAKGGGLGRALLEKQFGSTKIDPDEFLIFNQQLLTLNRSGLALAKSLELLTNQSRSIPLRELLADVRRRVQGGALVSEAFEATGEVPPMFTAALQAGERSGNLDETLEQYLNYQKVSRTLRKKIRSALVYPIFLLVFLIAMVTYITLEVVPKFAALYAEMDVPLPLITRIVTEVTLTIKDFALWIFLCLVAAFFFALAWRRTPGGRLMLDRMKYRLPMLGNILHMFSIAQYARTLATLLSGGIPILPALETSRHSTESPLLNSAVAEAQIEVRNGRSLAEALRTSNYFPDIVINLVDVGEHTGALVPMLNGAAEFYEEDANTRLTAFIALIDPILIFLLAFVVGIVLVAFYLPQFALVGRV